jgi:hypothetical protein
VAPDFIRSRIGVFPQELDCGHQHPACAEAALQGVMLVKRGPQCAQVPVFGQALDSLDLGGVRLRRQHEAGTGRATVDKHGAGAAYAVLAAKTGTDQAEVVPEDIG